MSTPKKAEAMSFEESLQELEAIVEHMEQGDLPLEDSLKQFERGILLARNSQQKLKQAEQKVKILMQQQDGETLTDFDQDTPSA